MPVKLIGMETVREADGLAMSSRNAYLSAQQRALAPDLYRQLVLLSEQIRQNKDMLNDLQNETKNRLNKSGFRVDYLEVRDATSLLEPGSGTENLVILTAVYLGNTRLIDNILV